VNETEIACHGFLVASGLTVLRGGWPDFLVCDKGGRAWGVECKTLGDDLRPGQVAMRKALETVLPILVVRMGRQGSGGYRTLYNEAGEPLQPSDLGTASLDDLGRAFPPLDKH
jgi:hypothetical protein